MATVHRFSQGRVVVWPADEPPPHFHILTKDGDCSFWIETFAVRIGKLPHYAREGLEWAKQNQTMLLAEWNHQNKPRENKQPPKGRRRSRRPKRRRRQ
jgi:hypothetical protein